jgi:hypothetical protein
VFNGRKRKRSGDLQKGGKTLDLTNYEGKIIKIDKFLQSDRQ